MIVGWGARPPLPFSLWESKSAREFERAQRGEGALKDGEEEVETGAEREKRLRKLAQRGVVRLFNAIGAAQGAPERSEREEAKKRKREVDDEGSQATTTVGELGVNKITRRPNVLGGRGKGEACESSFSSRSRLGPCRRTKETDCFLLPLYSLHLFLLPPPRTSVQLVKVFFPRSHSSRY